MLLDLDRQRIQSRPHSAFRISDNQFTQPLEGASRGKVVVNEKLKNDVGKENGPHMWSEQLAQTKLTPY